MREEERECRAIGAACHVHGPALGAGADVGLGGEDCRGVLPVNKVRRGPHVPVRHGETGRRGREVTPGIHIRHATVDVDVRVGYGSIGYDWVARAHELSGRRQQ